MRKKHLLPKTRNMKGLKLTFYGLVLLALALVTIHALSL